jgi:hypothetical protein
MKYKRPFSPQTIKRRFSPQGLKDASYSSMYNGNVTVMEIGIIEPGTSTFARLPLTVPTRALTNKANFSLRSARMTHFLNVVRANAVERYNVTPEEDVVFIRFLPQN